MCQATCQLPPSSSVMPTKYILQKNDRGIKIAQLQYLENQHCYEAEIKFGHILRFLCFALLAFVYDASCAHNLSWESWHFYPYLISVTFCQVNTVKNDTLKLFDSIEKYGMCIFAFNFVEIKIPNNNFKVFILWVFLTALRNMVCVPLLLVLSFLIISFEFVHLMLSFVPLPFILPVD